MFRSASSPPRFSTLILLTGLSLLSLNMFLPSLSNMAVDFRADYSLVSLSIAGYLAITAVLQLLIGPLSDRFGRRPVLLVCLAIFILASLVCALTTDIWVFLAFRVLQGVVIAGWALSLAMIRDVAPPREAASLIGYVSMAMAVSPMIGPIFGGALDEALGWRASFYTYFIVGLCLFALSWADVGETNANRSSTLVRQFRMYPQLLRAPRFWGYALCMAFSTAAFHAFLAGAPLVAATLYEMSPSMLGVSMGSISAGFMFGSFLSGRLAWRFALTSMMIAGRLVACTGLLVGLLLLASGITHVLLLFGPTIFVGIGNGLTTPSSSAGALSVNPQLAGSASGLAGALTVASGALLTPIASVAVAGDGGATALLAVMLSTSALGLAAALFVFWVERREKRDASDEPV